MDGVGDGQLPHIVMDGDGVSDGQLPHIVADGDDEDE